MIETLRWICFVPFFLLASCEREIDLVPADSEPKVVVEGTIENDKYPLVYLTRSLNYFSGISPEKLAGSFVHDAVIKISGDGKSCVLKEFELSFGGGYSAFYYTADSADASNSFKGQLGTDYSLSIEADGRVYESTTAIPELGQKIDYLYVEENVDNEDSSKVALYGHFVDPSGLGNYSRYFTQVGSEPFYAGLNSVLDDQVFDGKEFDLQIEQGVDRNGDIDYENYSFFRKGDSVSVKFCNIDKGVFDFWRTLEYSYASIGNPFSSPTKIKGNITNGALGYFGGYAVQYSSIRIPE